jgi:integrase
MSDGGAVCCRRGQAQIGSGMGRVRASANASSITLTSGCFGSLRMTWDGGLIKLLLLTAQRREKVVTMRRSDIREGTWNIPTEPGEKANAENPAASERGPRHYQRIACYSRQLIRVRSHKRTLLIFPTQGRARREVAPASSGYATMAATRPSADGQDLDGPSRRKAGYQ